MLATLLAVLLCSPALDQARQSFKGGNLDGVLIALMPKDAVPEGEAKEAAALLLDAAGLAEARKDKILALSLAQTALRRDPKNVQALRMLGEWSLKATELRLAVKYGKQWAAVEPQSEQARSFLARAEELDRSWMPPSTEKQRRSRRKASQQRPLIANGDLAAPRSWGVTVVESPPVQAGSARPANGQASSPAPSGQVVLYGTNWCGVCTHARAWLVSKGIPFEDRDIEKDRSAARALHEKQRKQNQRHRGVPVIEVNGKLLPAGFSGAAIEYALRHPG